MFFFNKQKEATVSTPEVNLHEGGRSDDDSFATRSSRTVGFEDEPTSVPEEDYSTRHSRSFLDAVTFDDDNNNNEGDGGLTTEEVEGMTDSQREARFKAAEVAELTDSQRENRANFLNESLVAKGTPALGSESSQHSRDEGLNHNYAQHENLMIEEGITINLLDATDRYQDNFVMDATKLAKRRERCAKYSQVGIIFMVLGMVMSLGSIIVIDQIEERKQRNNSKNSLKPGHTSHIETITTPSVEAGEFFEPEISFPETNYGSIEDDTNDKTQGPEFATTSTHFIKCTDNPNFLHNNEQGQNCEWVSLEETVKRCTRQGVKENCQATCDPACSAPPTTYPTEYPTFPQTTEGMIDDDDVVV